MNKISLLLLIVIPIFYSCNIKADNWIHARKGDGNVVKETRKVMPFDEIKASAGIDVFIFQGDEEKVLVEADENLMDCIITEVKESTLKCYIDCNIRHASKINVYVNYKKLNSLSASSGSDISGETLLKTDVLKINVDSGADIKVAVEAKELFCNVSSGAGATIEGTSDYFKGIASSGADIDGKSLTVKTCDLNASSAGDIKVSVTEKVIADASSGGDISYYGNPEIEHVSSSSGGDVTNH
ncbi:MAG: DUF2807 domain-containing protein [Prolixibacteraceae bacterium]|nr:DUF2807 domain-containing protein [Prolixibacteraceae bacterium]